MANTALNRTEVAVLTNKSGGSVARGDTVILSSGTANAFTTTTTANYEDDIVGVVLEPNGIANDATGLVALAGYVPLITLASSASLGDYVYTHTVAKQAQRSGTKSAGAFGQVLGTGTSPAAILFGGLPKQTGSSGTTVSLWLPRKLYDNTIAGAAAAWNIQESDLTAGSGTFASYDKLEIIADNMRSSVAATSDTIYLLYGTGGGALDTTAANYGFVLLLGQSAGAAASQGDNPTVGASSGASSTANYNGAFKAEIFNPGAATHKRAVSTGSLRFDTTTSHQARIISHVWENTGAIDRIGIRTDNDPTDLLAIGSHLIIIGYKNVNILTP